MALLPADLLRRFRPIRELGAGGCGTVYLVEDLGEAPSPKALKVVPRSGSDPRPVLLRREFSFIRRLRHPGLVRVFDFGDDEPAGLVWFTSEFVPGPDLYQASAGYGPSQLEEALLALAETLVFLHERKLLHNDLKPSNVRVPGAAGSLRLLDFGLASSLLGGPAFGTPPFMAPERLGRASRGNILTDLYGLGAVLYLCAVRRRPFEGESAAEVLASIGAGLVPPRVLRPDLPHYLDEAVVRLLSLRPADRFASAAELLDHLGRSGRAARPDRPDDAPVSSDTLPGPPLLDRDALVSDLARSAEAAREGGGAACALLLGEAGLGKSRILEELRQRLELEGWAVVAVQGRASLRAFGLLHEIARRLALLPGAPPPPPPLAALLAPAGEGGGNAVEGVREAFAAHVLACAEAAPLALLADDLGEADVKSAEAVMGLAAAAGNPALPGAARLALFAATRDGPGSGEDAWARLSAAPVHRLQPLSVDAQRALLSSLFPGARLPARLLSEAVAMAAGNPLALEEIARAWLGAGAARKTPGGYRFRQDVAVPGAATPRELVAARLRTLDPPRLRLVRLCALAGGPLAPALLLGLCGDARAEAADPGGSGFLRETPDGVDVRHPLVREAALAGLEEEEARTLRLALGGALAEAGAPDEDVWAHLLRGGDLARGLPRALGAGLRALAVEDHRAARAILEEARRADEAHPGSLPEPDRRRLGAALAECLDETGDHAAGAALMEWALAGASPTEAPALHARLGRMLYRTGDLARAEEILRSAAASGTDPSAVVEAATWLSTVLFALVRIRDSRDVLVRFGAAARALEAEARRPGLLVRYHLSAAFASHNAVGLDEALSDAAAAVRTAESAESPHLVGLARTHRAFLLCEKGELALAREDFAEAERRLAPGGTTIGWVDLCRHRGTALHRGGDSRAALGLLRAATEAKPTPVQSAIATASTETIWAELGDPDVPSRVAGMLAGTGAGHLAPILPDLLDAGLRSLLWSGRTEHRADLERRLAALDPASVAPADLHRLGASRAVVALVSGDTETALAHLAEAITAASRFSPVSVPGLELDRAYAFALRERPDEARAAAARAEAGYAGLGNRTEEGRARALGRAIAAGRILRPPDASDLHRRALLRTERGALSGEPAAALVEAVAGTAEASAVWLLAGSPDDPRVAARAGPCAGADPLAWSAPIERALGAAEPAQRPGVGLVLPAALGGEACAIVVEDRAFPGAFSAEAAGAVEIAVARALEALECRRLAADLAVTRQALDAALARPAPSSSARSTLPTSRSRVPGSLLPDVTAGSVVLRHAFDRIVGRSKPMRRALQVIDRAVAVDASVLVLGETGTGKELVARALHEQGRRAAGPFLAVNCAAISPALAESELFGHVPGAFTGAGRARHAGYFEQASGGTLFLDEVTELPPPVQAKLLRAIEEKEVRPLGADKAVPVDVRIVAAANRDPHEEARRERFRIDLLYRLAVIEVHLPPLRERADDIPLLVVHLLREIADPPPAVSPEALEALCRYPWPGNVRELRNQLERAAAMCRDGLIPLEILAADVRSFARSGARARTGRAHTLRHAVDALERRLVADALRAAAGKKVAAARALGLTPTGLTLKMRRLGLEAARPPRRR